MTTNRENVSGCWTCRLRRKKCDNTLPVCSACDMLEINCYQEKSKPGWMDNGSRQQEMTQRIKADIKHNGRRRRGKRKIQIIARDIGDDPVGSLSPLSRILPSSAGPPASPRASPRIPSGSGNTSSANNDSTELEPSSQIRTDWISFPGTGTSHRRTSCPSSSGEGPLQQHPNNLSAQDARPQDLSLADNLEPIFIMAYLDYVFPVSFPFYRPTILEGARSWLLNSILSNKCLRHTIISLTSYFFSVVKVNPESGHQICESYSWEALQRQTELALKKAQHDLHEFSCNSVRGNILDTAKLIESVVQLLTVEVILGSTENWQMHLDAAGLLFQQLLSRNGKDSPCSAAFSLVLEQLGCQSNIRTSPQGPLWNPDQASFRFFSTILLFNDIIASTPLEQPPKFREYHPHLLGNDLHPSSEPPLQLADVLGCPNWAMLAIGEIATLDAWKKSMKKANQLSMMELVQRAAVIDQRLRDGLASLSNPSSQPRQAQKRRPPITQLDMLSFHPPYAPETLNTITRIWALAARSYLLTTVSGWQLANPELRSNVARTIGLLTKLAASPTWLRTLAWPLCVTGCVSDAGEEAILRQLLAEMGSLQAFGTVCDALGIMEHVWRNRSKIDTETWDLAKCFGCLGHRVLLV